MKSSVDRLLASHGPPDQLQGIRRGSGFIAGMFKRALVEQALRDDIEPLFKR